MLDVKWIRAHQAEVEYAARHKGIEVSIPELLELDEVRRSRLAEIEALRQSRNALTEEIGMLLKRGDQPEAARKKQAVKDIHLRLNDLEAAYRLTDQAYTAAMLRVPNPVSPDTPAGQSDKDNVELYRAGTLPDFAFEPKDHVALGNLHRMIDIPRGVKTAGPRQYYLTGAGVLLHRAVQQLALDLLLDKGFTPVDVPLMARGEALLNTGYFPLGEEQTFKLAEEDKWLVGTSEVPLVSYYSNEIVDLAEPVKMAAVSLCFRSEVGSAGRDVHGLYRVHQFAKVEQVIICENSLEKSDELLREITTNAEELMRLLELPYRVVAVCCGDMGQKTYKQVDIETWMPSRNAYGETHSSSNLLDFQARRSNIRYRNAEGRLTYAYTLNNTAVASPRILIPLLENHQREDGSIRIPEALRKYMNGIGEIRAVHE
ncbi:serine--tRNA ligase [Paenibacillus chitinolyticus]|uniref:serine--tRNA ligase n=1 Tax=Paenibacillus chitinolyticus TaxID=79263 RepID=UPI002DB6FA65|nr:serine--tRNA ligase [Paenibacillus chitinolyticus]MEC0248567.1 serine--tRNA ligase [Paenibacillus chitinolyticus]